MSKAEAVWTTNARAEDEPRSAIGIITTNSRHNFQSRLCAWFMLSLAHFPPLHILRAQKTLNDNRLYWSPVASENEAKYLVAILNSETASKRESRTSNPVANGARAISTR